MRKLTPTPYSNRDSEEVLAVNKLHCLIHPDKVKLDIKSRDKFPNIDGYMELVDGFRVPDGKLEVQIKKLPNTFDHSKPKIKIEKSLLAYSKKGTANPVLHIGVDIHNNTAYWVYIHDKLKNTRGKQLINYSGKTTTIPLNLDNIDNGIIEYGKDDYVEPWKSIFLKHIKSINDCDAKIKKFHELELHSEPTLGEYADEFVYIHIFLDELNEKLGYFDIIKKRFYFTDTWKLGLAYNIFSDKGLSYALFPISYNKNDIQIKKIKLGDNILTGLKEFGSGTGHLGYNPIKTNPKNYAKEVIESHVNKLLKDKFLSHCNGFIAKEIIFAVLDNVFGLSKDFYSLEDIKSIQIDKGVKNKYKNYNLCPELFFDAISFLESKNIKKINRIYLPHNYEREGCSNLIWNSLSYNSARKNLEIVFQNLQSVYNDILSCNFPKIYNDLSLFKGASKVIGIYSLKDNYIFYDYPSINIFYLKSEEPEDFEIRLYDVNERPFNRQDITSKPEIKFEGKPYQLVRPPISIPLEFLYEDTPMLNYVYSILGQNLRVFFRNWKAK